MLYPGLQSCLCSLLWAFGERDSRFLQLLFTSEGANREASGEISNLSTCLGIHIFISVVPMDCIAMWQCSIFIFKWKIYRWSKCQGVKSIFLPFFPSFMIFSLIYLFHMSEMCRLCMKNILGSYVPFVCLLGCVVNCMCTLPMLSPSIPPTEKSQASMAGSCQLYLPPLPFDLYRMGLYWMKGSHA